MNDKPSTYKEPTPAEKREQAGARTPPRCGIHRAARPAARNAPSSLNAPEWGACAGDFAANMGAQDRTGKRKPYANR